MKNSDVHVRVVYGWMNKFGSEGLIDFTRDLKQRGFDVKDDILWAYADNIAALLDADNHKARAIIGFSMGANCVTWVSNRIKRPIELGVCYDASTGIPWISPAHLEAVSPKIKKCLSYQGTGWPVGGAVLKVMTVEIVKTGHSHFSNIYAPELHQRTLFELGALLGKDS